MHLGAGVVVVLAELAIFTTFNHWFYYNPWAPAPAEFGDAYTRNVLRGFHDAFLVYWVIVAAAHAFAFRHDDQQRALREAGLREKNAELESLLARSRLEALRAQLHPHFLFNAFNTISSLIRTNHSQAATDMVARLGHLMRLVLKSLDRSEIPLQEELELVDAYLRVERARFEGRLEVNIDVSQPSMNSLVPSMLLQPLVENADSSRTPGNGRRRRFDRRKNCRGPIASRGSGHRRRGRSEHAGFWVSHRPRQHQGAPAAHVRRRFRVRARNAARWRHARLHSNSAQARGRGRSLIHGHSYRDNRRRSFGAGRNPRPARAR